MRPIKPASLPVMVLPICLTAALESSKGALARPLLFGLYLDELEKVLEASSDTDAPGIADILLAILLFADDIALFSYSVPGLHKRLDILADFCAARGLTVNVKKTKTLVFEHRKSATQPFGMEQMSLSKWMSST